MRRWVGYRLRLIEISPDKTRCNHICSNIKLSVVARQCTRHCNQRALCSDIRCVRLIQFPHGCSTDIDDATISLRHHRRQDCLATVEGAMYDNLPRFLKILPICISDCPANKTGEGVINQYVNTSAKFVLRLFYHGVYCVDIGYISTHCNRSTSIKFNLFNNCIGGILVMGEIHHNTPALFGIMQRCCCAYATTSACDNRHFIFQ